MKVTIITAFLSLLVAGRLLSQGHEHGHAVQPAAAVEASLAVPAAMQVEHGHLHEQLAAALAAGGKTAEAASRVEAVLAPHFKEEEAFAMPPLGLLQSLAGGKQPTAEQARAAIEMANTLRAKYGQMLDEHRQITEALQALEGAAKAEGKPRHAEFATALALHAQHEEQVLYPATLILGEYLEMKAAAPR